MLCLMFFVVLFFKAENDTVLLLLLVRPQKFSAALKTLNNVNITVLHHCKEKLFCYKP